MSNLENQIQIYKENLDKFLNSISDGTLDEQVTYIRQNYDSLSDNEKQEIQAQITTWERIGRGKIKSESTDEREGISEQKNNWESKTSSPTSRDILNKINSQRSTFEDESRGSTASVVSLILSRIRDKIPSGAVIANRIFNPRRPNRTSKILPESFNKVNNEVTINKNDLDGIKQYDNGESHLIVFNITNNDKVLVFRMANFTGLADTITPEFTQQKYFGRAEPYYQYSGVTRNISFTFDLVVHNKVDTSVIYSKLNSLISLAYPHKYTNNNMIEPNIIKLSIARYIVDKPFFLTNISVTGADDVVYQRSKPSIVTVNVQGNLLEANEYPSFEGTVLTNYVDNGEYPGIVSIGDLEQKLSGKERRALRKAERKQRRENRQAERSQRRFVRRAARGGSAVGGADDSTTFDNTIGGIGDDLA